MRNNNIRVIKEYTKNNISYVELQPENMKDFTHFITQAIGSGNFSESIKNGEKTIIMNKDAYVITAKKLLLNDLYANV